MAVDTHIFRVANRTGLAPGKDAAAVETRPAARVPAAYRVDAHHWLILHGRYVCQARKPLCEPVLCAAGATRAGSVG
jgi:endonuclease III